MKLDLSITDIKIPTPDGILNCGVGVNSGRIAVIASDSRLLEADRMINGKGMFLLPGVIDPHVHSREMGFEYKEDFATCSAGAAAGGVTTFLDMPSGVPAVDTVQNLEEKLRRVHLRSYVDFGLYAMITEQNISELPALLAMGVVGFKLYMAETAVKTAVPDSDTIFQAFQVLAHEKAIVAIHAEDNILIQAALKRARQSSRQNSDAYDAARPTIAEGVAAQSVILLGRKTGCRVSICHMSSIDAMEAVAAGKLENHNVFGETCPQYLTFTKEILDHRPWVSKINPPIRGSEHSEALWEALGRGIIDMIGSDHSPQTLPDKTSPSLWDAVSGFSSIELSLPVMLMHVKAGRLNLNRLIEVMSTNPARIFGLYPRKGIIAIGSDADFVLVDLKKDYTVRAEDLHGKSNVTPYEGLSIAGRPVMTVSRGRVIYEEGQLVGGPAGIFVKPSRDS